MVAKAMPVKRSIKGILDNIACFSFIVTEMFTLFVKKNTSYEKIEKLLYTYGIPDNNIV